MISASKTRVVIIDDYEVFRDNLKRVIACMDDFEVVGEAGEMGLGLSRVLWLKPELVTVDISLPDQNGIALTREIKKQEPQIKILVITIHSSLAYIGESIRAGANGYLLKTSAADQAREALLAVAGGSFYGDPTLPMDWPRLMANRGAARSVCRGGPVEGPLGGALHQNDCRSPFPLAGEAVVKER